MQKHDSNLNFQFLPLKQKNWLIQTRCQKRQPDQFRFARH